MSQTEPARAPATARVFFALWPDDAVRRELARRGERMHRLLGGKPTRAESIHMTLLFLGDVPAARVDSLRAVGDRITFEPFALEVDQAQCWKHNKVAWVGPSQMPAALAGLVASLEAAVGNEGFAFDRRPFAAHITLARKAHCVPLPALSPLTWPVADFVLVRSELNSEGSRYEVIGRWGSHRYLSSSPQPSPLGAGESGPAGAGERGPGG
jgi:2'-5' RNA ligase